MKMCSKINFITLSASSQMKKKESNMKTYASQTLSNIRNECRKNKDGEFIITSYKPLLCESMQSNGGRKTSAKKSSESTRYKTKTASQTFNDFIASQVLHSTPLFQKPLVPFLKQLYGEKIKDLNTLYNKKQEQIFINRLQSLITKEKFEAIQCDLGLNCVNIISKYLKFNNIQYLTLDKNPLGDEGVKRLSKSFKHLELRHLSLISINITSKGGKQLFKSLVGLKTLESINFSSPEGFNRNRFNSEGIQQLIPVLQHEDCHLKSINLSNVSMGEKGFIHFCEGLSQNNSELQILNLSMNDIKLNKENLNFYASKFSLLFLKKLDLSQNKMGDLCLEMFAMVLGLNYGKNSLSTSLKQINLSKNLIKSHSCEIFCLQLVKNKTLTHLLLNNNHFSEGSHFYHFKYLLSNNWTITHLGFRNSIQNHSDLMILADGLQNSHSLISLDVSYNSFDEDTFNYMMSHLSNNKSLKYLKMDTCNIIDKYIVKAEPYLKGNKSIQSLDFSNNYINDKGAKNLLRLLMQNHKIYELSLKKNCICLSILNEIEYMLKENQIARTYAQPDLHYYNLIENIQEDQKRSLEENIENLQIKMEKARLYELVQDIVEKESQIHGKMEKINQEKKAVTNLEKSLNRNEDNFMITS